MKIYRAKAENKQLFENLKFTKKDRPRRICAWFLLDFYFKTFCQLLGFFTDEREMAVLL